MDTNEGTLNVTYSLEKHGLINPDFQLEVLAKEYSRFMESSYYEESLFFLKCGNDGSIELGSITNSKFFNNRDVTK